MDGVGIEKGDREAEEARRGTASMSSTPSAARAASAADVVDLVGEVMTPGPRRARKRPTGVSASGWREQLDPAAADED